MKKIKNLLFLIPIVGSIAVPFSTMTSCSKQDNWNLMNEYLPTIKAEEMKWYEKPIDVVDHYMDLISNNPEIFKQDMIYTLSRGLPQYVAYVSEFCEIVETKYDAKINEVNVDKVNRKISFEIVARELSDYTGTKKEELQYYDMNYFKWDATTTAQIVLDLNTDAYPDTTYNFDQRQQLTTFAGAAQFGISEVNSTIQLISQKGYAIDLNGNKIDVSTNTPGEQCHFILPNEEFWMERDDGNVEQYNKNLTEVWNLWLNYWGLQTIILILKYYMPSNIISKSQLAPNTFDFGSYHLKDANLDDIFTIKNIGGANYLCGFNYSLDSAKNLINLRKLPEDNGIWDEDSKIFTIPTIVPGDSTFITAVSNDAFNSNLSLYSNIGLPYQAQTLVIPASLRVIGKHAFALTPTLKTIKFNIESFSEPGSYDYQSDAFSQLTGVNKIDFSNSTPDAYNKLLLINQPFKSIHYGLETQLGVPEGEIHIPNCDDNQKNGWKTAIEKLGLTIYNGEMPTQKGGWKIIMGS